MWQVFTASWALFLGMFMLMVGNGVQGTLLGIRGGIEEFSTFHMSIVMSGYFVGFLGGSRLAPDMIRRVGHVRVFAALGSTISAVLILLPILLPIAMNDYNISAYQFGVVMCLNLVLGLLTPPVGVGLYIASSMSGTSPGRILRSLWPFLLAVSIVLVLLSRFPWFSTALI